MGLPEDYAGTTEFALGTPYHKVDAWQSAEVCFRGTGEVRVKCLKGHW